MTDATAIRQIARITVKLTGCSDRFAAEKASIYVLGVVDHAVVRSVVAVLARETAKKAA